MNENTKIVQNAYEKFAAGDIEGVLNLLSEDTEWTAPEVLNSPLGGTWRGRASIADYFSKLDETEEIIQFEPREFIGEGDRVVVLGRIASKIKATGRKYETDWVHIYTVREGEIENFLEFFDTAAVQRAFQKAETA